MPLKIALNAELAKAYPLNHFRPLTNDALRCIHHDKPQQAMTEICLIVAGVEPLSCECCLRTNCGHNLVQINKPGEARQ